MKNRKTKYIISALLALAVCIGSVAFGGGLKTANAAAEKKIYLTNFYIHPVTEFAFSLDGSYETVQIRQENGTETLTVQLYMHYFPALFWVFNAAEVKMSETVPFLLDLSDYDPLSDWVVTIRGKNYTLTSADFLVTVVDDPVDPPIGLPETPVKPHYDFVCWCLDEALTIPYDGRPITEDMTFYAKWQLKRYTVTYVTNSSVSLTPETADALSVFQAAATASKVGYAFKGWYTDEALTQAYAPGELTGDLTLYAKWETATVKVTFMVDGAVYKTMDIPYGATLATAQTLAGMALYNIKSVSFENGAGEQVSGQLVITDDAVVDAQLMSAAQQVDTAVKTYWIGGLLGIGLIALIAALFAGRKKKKVIR